MAINSSFLFWGTNIRDSNATDEKPRSPVSEAFLRPPLFLQMHHFHPKSPLALNPDQLLMLPLSFHWRQNKMHKLRNKG